MLKRISYKVVGISSIFEGGKIISNIKRKGGIIDIKSCIFLFKKCQVVVIYNLDSLRAAVAVIRPKINYTRA